MSSTQIPISEIQDYMRGLVKEKQWTADKLAKKANIYKNTAVRFLKYNRALTTENSLKVMQALGFEIKLIKKQGRAARLFDQLLGLGSSDLVEIT